MVKLVSLKCPECGAALSVENDMKRCFCTHCGTKLIIDEETAKISIDADEFQEAGYNFEVGRKQAQNEDLQALTLSIKSLCDSAKNIESLKARHESLKRDLSEANYILKKYSSFKKK